MESAASIAPMQPAGRARSSLVLIVEDSPTQALQLAHVLQSAGIAVHCVDTGAAALKHIAGALPDLVITDFHLPGMAGDELCRRIRLNPRARDLPILMLTGEAGAELQGLHSGVDAYVSKSDGRDVLLLRVRALLRRGGEGAVETALSPGPSCLIVVGEDTPWRCELAAELEKEGWLIRCMGTGEAQGSAILDTDGLLILHDKFDALALCRRVANEADPDPHGGSSDDPLANPHSRPVVLLITACDDRESITQAFEAGADDVVAASRDMTIIRARLRALLRRKLLRDQQWRTAARTRQRDLQLAQAQAAKEAAEAKAALAERLEIANRELRDTQVQLVQAEKMASLGHLVAGIAHEINNPLAFVVNHERTIDRAIEQIAAEISPLLSEDGLRRLHKVRTRIVDSQLGLARIQDLVVKLRTFSRLDEGSLKQIDLRESIESVLMLLQYRLGDRIRVVRNFDGPATLWCYAGLLNQVVMNVMTNAIDAIEQVGEIAIRTRATRGFVEIEIADSGSGMPESVRRRIFDPFFTTKPVGSGTGLGLSISYSILQRHRGSLEVSSQESRGTQVLLRIPDDLGASATPDAGETA